MLDAADPTNAAYQNGLELCMKFETFMAAMRREVEDGRTPLGQLPSPTRGCTERAEAAMGALRRALCPKVTAGPYVVVTPEQLAPVAKALRAEGVGFSIAS